MKLAAQFAVPLLFSTFIAACASPGPDPDAGYVVSGAITDDAGKGTDDVLLTLVGDKLLVPMKVRNEADGGYSLPGVQSGSYKLSPSKIGFRFTPPFRDVTVNNSAVSGQNFVAAVETAPTYKVSGTITASIKGAWSTTDVLVTLTNTKTGAIYSTSSDNAGVYSFASILAGTYTLKPYKNSVTYTPAERTVTVATTDVTVLPIASVENTYTVSGAITTKTNQDIRGVTLNLTGGAASVNQTATSGADGRYTFQNKVRNDTYLVVPSKNGLAFTPDSRSVKVEGKDVAVPEFVASAGPPAPPLTCDSTNWCRPSAPELSQVLSAPIFRIWAANTSDIWFVGSGGTILRYSSVAAGQNPSWTRMDAGVAHDLYAIWGTNSANVWVAGIGGTGPVGKTVVYHYVQAANPEWSIVSSPSAYQEINVLWSPSATDSIGYAGCMDVSGSFAQDGGSWTGPVLPIYARIYGAWAASSNAQWAVGRRRGLNGSNGPTGMSLAAPGVMYQLQADGGWADTNDGLKLWTPEFADAGSDSGFSDIRGMNASDVWVVGANGIVGHFEGTNWKLVDAGVGSTNLYGVYPVSASEVWISGGDGATGKLVKLTNSGSGWTPQPITTVPADAGVLYRVYVDSASKFVWLGSSTGILLYKY